jgi:hypothetical protein
MTWNYDYPGQNSGPRLYVHYDNDATDGENYVRTEIVPYAARGMDCENAGKTYNFYQRGNLLYIQEED